MSVNEELLPPITEVQRLHLGPGDCLVVRLAGRLPPGDAESVRESVRQKVARATGLDPAQVRVMVVDESVEELTVVSQEVQK